MVTPVERHQLPRFRAPDATAFALADPQSRLVDRGLDPACEPAKVCVGLLLMPRLLTATVTVTWVDPHVPRFLAPNTTAFALAAPHSGLACRSLTGAFSKDPACESAKALADFELVRRILVLVTVVMVVRIEPAVPTFRAAKATVDCACGLRQVCVLASIAGLFLMEAMAGAARLCQPPLRWSLLVPVLALMPPPGQPVAQAFVVIPIPALAVDLQQTATTAASALRRHLRHRFFLLLLKYFCFCRCGC